MKIKKLNLYTNKLQQERVFYSNTLGFELLREGDDFFTIRVGWSELTFTASDKSHSYHYCFLIPSNQLTQALDWMEAKVDIVDIENGRKVQNFKSWNADSFYFYDASGNLAEFIVRYDLNNENTADFSISSVLCVNEIGMPTKNIKATNSELKRILKTELWKGDLERFGANGNDEGIFLLPNYEVKNKWFPTNQKINTEPFEALIENNDSEYYLKFSKGRIE